MIEFPRRLPGTAARAFALLLTAVMLSACGGNSATPTPTPSPSPTPLSDPRAIIGQSLLNLEKAGSFHLDGTIAGSVNMSAVGKTLGSPIGLSGSLDLKGGTITGDVNTTGPAAHVTVTLASLFGLSIDVIEVDGFTYTKVNLTADKYTKTATDVSAVASALPGGSLKPEDAVTQIALLFQASGANATLAGHTEIEGRDAFKVDVSIPPDKLAAELEAATGMSDITIDSASGTYWAYKDTVQPARLELKASSSSLGNIDLTVTFTKYGQPVSIAAPPADQIAGS